MKSLSMAIMLLSGLAASAQFDFGLKAGLNNTKLNMDDINNPGQIVESLQAGEPKYGFHFGVFSAVNFLTYQVRAEAYYSLINVEYTGRNANNEPISETVAVSRLDFPVLFGLRFGPLRANLGPVISYNFSTTNDVLENGLKDATAGGQVGLGLDFWKLMVEARYEFGLSRFANQVKVEGQSIPADSRASLWMISIGYKLF